MNLKRIIPLIVLALLIVAQFFVKSDNVSSYESVKAFEQEEKVIPKLSGILKNQCYDCHSNHTNYPWYNKIGLVSIVLNHHIEEGKEHLNFSDWSNYTQNQKEHKLHEVYEEVEENEMPLKMYSLTHPSLSNEEKTEILSFFEVYK